MFSSKIMLSACMKFEPGSQPINVRYASYIRTGGKRRQFNKGNFTYSMENLIVFSYATFFSYRFSNFLKCSTSFIVLLR